MPDLSYILKIANGDEEFMNEIIGTLRLEFLEQKAHYYYSKDHNDHLGMAKNVHLIIHKIGILGMDKEIEIAREYERSLRNGEFANAEIFEEVLKKISSFLEIESEHKLFD